MLDGKPFKSLLAIGYSQDIRAEALVLIVIDALQSYGVASVMSGDFGGMQDVATCDNYEEERIRFQVGCR